MIGLLVPSDSACLTTPNALRCFGIPSKGVNSPGAYVPFHRSSAPQLVTVDDTPRISAPRAKRIQEIVGVLMYLANALDATLLTRSGHYSPAPPRRSRQLPNASYSTATNGPMRSL
jgi:hypothetical protein